jgi:hypothetical protein
MGVYLGCVEEDEEEEEDDDMMLSADLGRMIYGTRSMRTDWSAKVEVNAFWFRSVRMNTSRKTAGQSEYTEI